MATNRKYQDFSIHHSIKVLAAMLTVMASLAWMNPVQAKTFGPYLFSNVHSGKCLDIVDHSNDKTAFAVQNPCNIADKWYLDQQPSGAYLIRNARSGQCLNVYGGGTEDGTFVIQYPCSATAKNNLWNAPFSWTVLQLPLLPPVMILNPVATRITALHSGKAFVVYGATLDDTGFIVEDGRISKLHNDLWIPVAP